MVVDDAASEDGRTHQLVGRVITVGDIARVADISGGEPLRAGLLAGAERALDASERNRGNDLVSRRDGQLECAVLLVEVDRELHLYLVAVFLERVVASERRASESCLDAEGRSDIALLDNAEHRLAEGARVLTEVNLVMRPCVARGLVEQNSSGLAREYVLAGTLVDKARNLAGLLVEHDLYEIILERVLGDSDSIFHGRLALGEDSVELVSESRNLRHERRAVLFPAVRKLGADLLDRDLIALVVSDLRRQGRYLNDSLDVPRVRVEDEHRSAELSAAPEAPVDLCGRHCLVVQGIDIQRDTGHSCIRRLLRD